MAGISAETKASLLRDSKKSSGDAILARTSGGRGHHSVSEMNQFVLVQQPDEANPLKIQDRKAGPLRAFCIGMTAKLAFERPVTIGALTAIAEGVMPNSSSSPISLLWTLLRRLLRKG
jgi:hypothetical protein